MHLLQCTEKGKLRGSQKCCQRNRNMRTITNIKRVIYPRLTAPMGCVPVSSRKWTQSLGHCAKLKGFCLPSRKASCLFTFTESVPEVFLFNLLLRIQLSLSDQVAKWPDLHSNHVTHTVWGKSWEAGWPIEKPKTKSNICPPACPTASTHNWLQMS